MSCFVTDGEVWQAEKELLAVPRRGGDTCAEVVRLERTWQLGDLEKQGVTECAAEAKAVAVTSLQLELVSYEGTCVI